MTIHLIKLCVGANSVEDLREWQEERLAREGRLRHWTRHMPRRNEELLAGGSLYWVIRGFLQVRQRVIGLERGTRDDGSPCCGIVLEPDLVAVVPATRDAFQGWRYLQPADAPADLATVGGGNRNGGFAESPPIEMMMELRALGLI